MTRFSTPFTSCCDTTTPILRLPLCVVVTNIVFALVLLAAGCSSSSSDTTAETSIPTTTSTDAPTTTQATSVETTDPEPSVTTTPPAEWTPEELEIIEAYNDFRSSYLAVFISGGEGIDVLRNLVTADVSEPLIEGLQTAFSDGSVYSGTDETSPVAVDFVTPVLVELTICAWDQTARVRDGATIDSPNETPLLEVAQMRMVNGRWLMDGTIPTGSEQPCDLGQ